MNFIKYVRTSLIAHGSFVWITFLDFAEPAIFAAFAIKFEIFLVESFPGGWFSSGL